MLRLGADFRLGWRDPEDWVRDLGDRGFTAAVWPETIAEDPAEERRWAAAAEAAGIVIAEVAVWGNPIHPDPVQRRQKIDRCCRRLAVADRISARCCVTTAGSRDADWLKPHPENLSEDTFALIVDTVRAIIDAVRPTRTWFTLECMPWIWPDSPDAYARLLAAVDRSRFGVHLDPVNMVTEPRRFFDTTTFIHRCFDLLGPHLRSCHLKDLRMEPGLTLHLQEVQPGQGRFDHATFLRRLRGLGGEPTVLLEHADDAAYQAAARHLRRIAAGIGVPIRGPEPRP
jgi:sugar phosphate isomerase/epimerase